MGEEVMPQQGYDPQSGRAILGYDPNTGKAVYAEPEKKPLTRQEQAAHNMGGKLPVKSAKDVIGEVADALPTLGGAAGGLIGGIGGTAFGLEIGRAHV